MRVSASVLVPVALAVLAASNVTLLLQNQRLKNGTANSSAEDVREGARIPAVAGASLDGRFTSVEFTGDGRRTLVITFSAVCPFCERNTPFWLELAKSLDDAKWRTVWVSRDPLKLARAFAGNTRLTGQVLAEITHRTYSHLSMKLVPRTLVVGPKGDVERVWIGELSDAQRESISTYVVAVTAVKSNNSNGAPIGNLAKERTGS